VYKAAVAEIVNMPIIIMGLFEDTLSTALRNQRYFDYLERLQKEEAGIYFKPPTGHLPGGTRKIQGQPVSGLMRVTYVLNVNHELQPHKRIVR
jgi:hypothetical protein